MNTRQCFEWCCEQNSGSGEWHFYPTESLVVNGQQWQHTMSRQCRCTPQYRVLQEVRELGGVTVSSWWEHRAWVQMGVIPRGL